MRSISAGTTFVLCLLAFAAHLSAEGIYNYRIPLKNLPLTDGKIPEMKPGERLGDRYDRLRPYAILDVPGEAYVVGDNTDAVLFPNAPAAGIGIARRDSAAALAIRTASDEDITGHLYVPRPDATGMVALKFKIPKDRSTGEAAAYFVSAKLSHFQTLNDAAIPGGAWFRHQLRDAQKEFGKDPGAVNPRIIRPRIDDFQDTFALFTGGRAISENLQLDRMLPLPPNDPNAGQLVDVSTLTGVTIKEMDWAPRLEGLNPQLDPLAKFIPADQHAVFFPTFDAMVRLADEADLSGTPVLYTVEPRAEDARTKQRYERQLCLSLTGLGRLIGPTVIKSVAITGSDPYLRVGSDLAIVLEAKNAASLEKLVLTQVALGRQLAPDAKPVNGEIKGISYSGALSGDRSISAYVARLGDAVVVTNSLAQLERLISISKGESPSIDSLGEYRFFRSRYSRQTPGETAFVMLTDATLRRWCSPRWRITDSRRTRAAALLSEVQAEYSGRFAAGEAAAGEVKSDLKNVADLGPLTATRNQTIISPLYGSLRFMTPILEMKADKVTAAEAKAYERWRDSYQENWTQFFDPIAIQLKMNDTDVSADMTVMPLILNTTYRPIQSVTKGVAIKPAATDPHPEAIAHLALAINPKSGTVDFWAAFLNNLLPGGKSDLLSAAGQTLTIYADDDPWWNKLAAAKDPYRFLYESFDGLPVALSLEVKDAARMDKFLAAAQAEILESFPDQSKFDVLEHAGQKYIRITSTEVGRKERPMLAKVSVYYANLGDRFVATLHEGMMKHALERHAAGAAPGKEVVWQGDSAALLLSPAAWSLFSHAFGGSYAQRMQEAAWDDLPILNEWHRMFPDQDPVRIHEQLWQTRLIDPAGGKFVWNDQWKTMESTVFGHPGEPKLPAGEIPLLKGLKDAGLGLTFEDKGLRVRALLHRAAPKK